MIAEGFGKAMGLQSLQDRIADDAVKFITSYVGDFVEQGGGWAYVCTADKGVAGAADAKGLWSQPYRKVYEDIK